jgi:hypothetical protein
VNYGRSTQTFFVSLFVTASEGLFGPLRSCLSHFQLEKARILGLGHNIVDEHAKKETAKMLSQTDSVVRNKG